MLTCGSDASDAYERLVPALSRGETASRIDFTVWLIRGPVGSAWKVAINGNLLMNELEHYLAARSAVDCEHDVVLAGVGELAMRRR